MTPDQILDGRGCRLDLSRPVMMGILNVTPDSFFDGGRFCSLDKALKQGRRLFSDGAQVVDVGGESTRPGAATVSLEEELERVVPVIERLRRETDRPISVDTTKAQVARAAIAAGANFINDVSGLTFDPEIAQVAAETGAGLFLMHTSGRPDVMQQQTQYGDLLAEIISSLRTSIDTAVRAGVERSRIAVDPGIGFGKTAEGNLELLHKLDQLHQLQCPILLGTSRKSLIGRILGQDSARQRLYGSLATIALGVSQGVQLFRVHDPLPSRQTALVAWAIREQRLP